jgi:hypothetical protein
VGRWAPDLALKTDNGPVRLAELTTTARPLLLDLTEDAAFTGELGGWRDRVDTIVARSQHATPTALLLRPDCYIAWATDSPSPNKAERDSMRAALTTWFGAAARPRPGRAAVTAC